jgi:selenocysteine lyase/cysteine desulfurase
MRKFLRGPRGTGFLFVSDRVLEMGLEMLLPDMRSGHWNGPDSYQPASDARRFEYWEMSPALTLGGKAAVEYALEIGMDWIEPRVRTLAAQTRSELAELPGVRVLEQGPDLCGIVTAHAPNWEPKALMAFLWERAINARITPKYVAQIDFSRKGIDWALRISPHYYNTEEEISAIVAALREFKPR